MVSASRRSPQGLLKRPTTVSARDAHPQEKGNAGEKGKGKGVGKLKGGFGIIHGIGEKDVWYDLGSPVHTGNWGRCWSKTCAFGFTDIVDSGCEITESGCDITKSGCDITKSGCDIIEPGCDITELGCDIAESKILVLPKTTAIQWEFLRYHMGWRFSSEEDSSRSEDSQWVWRAIVVICLSRQNLGSA